MSGASNCSMSRKDSTYHGLNIGGGGCAGAGRGGPIRIKAAKAARAAKTAKRSPMNTVLHKRHSRNQKHRRKRDSPKTR